MADPNDDFDPLAAVRTKPSPQAGAPPADDLDPLAAVRNPSPVEAKPLAASPPPSSGLGHAAALVGQGLAQGALSTAALPSQAEGFLGSVLENYVTPHLPQSWQDSLAAARARQASASPGGPIEQALESSPSQPRSLRPSTDQVNSLIGSAGLDSEKPEGLGENLLAAGARGLGGAAVFGPANVPALASGALGGATGEAAREAGAPGWLQFIAGAVPSLGISGWTGARALAQKADEAKEAVASAAADLSAATKKAQAADYAPTGNALANAKTAEDFAKQNLAEGKNALAPSNPDNPYVGAKADLQAAQAAVAQRTKEATQASEAVRDATIAQAEADAQTRMKAAQGVFQGVAEGSGSSKNLQDAGEALQDHARTWLTETLPAKVGSAWTPVDAAIPSETPGKLSAFRGALDSMVGDAGPLQGAVNALRPRLPQQLYDQIKDIPDEDVTWGQMKQLRTTLGDALSNPKVLNDVGAQNASRLYATLTSDMKSVAKDAGAGDEFDAANAESSRLFGLAEGPVAKLVASAKPSAADPDPEKVSNLLLSGGKLGDSTLSALKDEGFPVGELLAGAHGEDKLTSIWPKLSTQAKQTLVADPSHAQALDLASDSLDQAGKLAKATIEGAKAQHALGLKEIEQQAEGDFGPTTAALRAKAILQSNRDQINGLLSEKASASKSVAEAKQIHDAYLEQIESDRQAAAERLEAAKAKISAVASPDKTENLIQLLHRGVVGATAGWGLEQTLNAAHSSPGFSTVIPGIALGASTVSPLVRSASRAIKYGGAANPLIGGIEGTNQGLRP